MPGEIQTTDCTLYQWITDTRNCVKNIVIDGILSTAEHAVSKAANFAYTVTSAPPKLLWELGRGITRLPDSVINEASSLVGNPIDSDIHSKIVSAVQPILKTVESFTTFGGGCSEAPIDPLSLDSVAACTPKPTINFLHLIGPAYAYCWFSKKMQKNLSSVGRSVSNLAKGIFTNKWNENIHIQMPGCGYEDGFSAGIRVNRSYGFLKLSQNILVESCFAAAWGSLAYLTQRGIGNAVAEATDSPTANNLIKYAAVAIAVAQFLPVGKIFNQTVDQFRDTISEHKTIKLNDRKFVYSNFDQKKDEFPIESLLKEIEDIEKGTRSLDEAKHNVSNDPYDADSESTDDDEDPIPPAYQPPARLPRQFERASGVRSVIVEDQENAARTRLMKEDSEIEDDETKPTPRVKKRPKPSTRSSHHSGHTERPITSEIFIPPHEDFDALEINTDDLPELDEEEMERVVREESLEGRSQRR